jgi:oligopeptide/dipeptide ABC transporter ATP-binding protein
MYLGQVVERASTEQLFLERKHPYTQGLLASIPSIDPDHRSLEVRVLGDVPSASKPPSGCRFHTRCPKAQARCAREAPELYTLEPRVVRCFLYDPVEPLVDPD